jgi:hypothetical protein
MKKNLPIAIIRKIGFYYINFALFSFVLSPFTTNVLIVSYIAREMEWEKNFEDCFLRNRFRIFFVILFILNEHCFKFGQIFIFCFFSKKVLLDTSNMYNVFYGDVDVLAYQKLCSSELIPFDKGNFLLGCLLEYDFNRKYGMTENWMKNLTYYASLLRPAIFIYDVDDWNPIQDKRQLFIQGCKTMLLLKNNPTEIK